MYRYIYGGDLKLQGSTVMTVLYLARKYSLKALTIQALRCARSFVTDAHVFTILEAASHYNDDVLIDLCLLHIQRNTAALLATDQFLDVSCDLLEKILSETALAISENALVDRCITWALHKLKQSGIEPTGGNLRDVLGQCLFKLQFHKMDAKSFTKMVVKRKLLPQAIAFDFYQFILGDDDPQLDDLPASFSCERRQKMYSLVDVASTLQKAQFPETFAQVYHIENVNIKTNKPIELSHLTFLILLEPSHSADQELCHLVDDMDAVVINGTPCCSTISCGANRESDGEPSKFRKLNGQMATMTLSPLIQVRDECVMSVKLMSTASIKLFPIGVDQLSDQDNNVKVTLGYARDGYALPLYNIGYSLCAE